ncbi:MAG: FeoB small GTPase domain-containing protein [Planctomycetia bacterium]|nr:FeoB small GTPase domain-containing protein [Planctomycetia bacterium]
MSLYPHISYEHGDFSIFLMGNSNTGKTTLFNELTGSREQVGERSGMTLELCRETFSFQGKSRVWVADMPGLYSMSVRSADEEVVLSAFLDQTPDVIVNVVDASHLEQNLYLTLQLLEMRIPMLMVLKMEDLAQKTGIQLDLRQLATRLGIPILTSDRKNGLHTETIKQKIVDVYQTGATSLTSTSGYWKIRQLARTILAMEKILAEELYHHVGHDSVHFSIEGMAVRFLEKDTFFIQKILEKYPFLREVEGEIDRKIALLEKDLGEASEIIIAENRYQGITEICKQCRKQPGTSRIWPF